MSIETELSEMSDSGQFEKIATAILRRANPLYEDAVQTGVNAEGKPITDPVDGFARVRGSDPPHFVFFEYTTTKRSDLESKWLANPDVEESRSKGDLIKAAELAEDVRDDVPNAEFTVVLVSNRPLKSNLLQAVQTEADELELSVDTWGVYQLSEFLNTNREGQWIRKQHFDKSEERLSKPLLMELSAQSLDAYQERFHIRVDGASVQRPELTTILKRAQDPDLGSYLIPIVGNSGFGKTVTCYQAMAEWLDSGPTLRLEPDDLQGAKSLSQALQSALDRLHPTLDSLAGQDALRIAQDTDRLLLVVDDLNRADDPSLLFSRILNWLGGVQDRNQPDAGGLAVTILCPLWPRIWAKQERDAGDSKFVEPIELGPFSSETAIQLIQSHGDIRGVDIDEQMARDLAERIGRDPHLIGLLGQLIGSEASLDDLPDTSKDVLQQYVEYAYETASDASEGQLIAPDYELAVEELSLNALANRELEPTWRAVREWIASDSDNLEAVRGLTTQAQLLILLQDRTEQILSFRHDRIRDYLLAFHSLNKIERADDSLSYLSDPYYYSILGKGIAYFRPSDGVLARLRDQTPLALLEALRELGGDAQAYEATLNTEVQRWLEEQGGESALLPSVQGEAMNLLRDTDSKHVLEITESFPQFPPILLARFRNGDLEAGIGFCDSHMGGSPNMNDPQRDSVFTDAMRRWGDQYADALSKALSSIDAEHVRGALRLAGFIGRSELGSGLEECWEQHSDDRELLPAFLWAAFQCGIPEHISLVNQIFDRWASLPSGSSINDDTDDEFVKGDVYAEVKFSLPREISEEQIRYLIEAVEEFPELEYHLLLLLNSVPDPDALELVVRKRGEHNQETDGLSHWSVIFGDEWKPDRSRGQALQPEMKARLKDLWTNEDIINEIRTIAFHLWSRNTAPGDLEELARVSDNDLFSHAATYRRLELNDKTVFRSSSFDIVENSRLLGAVPSAWCPEAYEIIDMILEQESPDEQDDLFYHLGDLLFRIPQDDAEQLLETHWETIGHRPKFFQAALYTATPLTRELAETTYEAIETPTVLFEHIMMNFGFNTRGRSELISQAQILSLEPYLAEIDELDLVRIAEKANEIGLTEWSADYIRPLLSEETRQQSYPTDEDLIQRLDAIKDGEDSVRNIRVWMREFDRRAESKTRAFRILNEWLTQDPSVDGYRMVAQAIKGWGTREDLSILDDISLEDNRIRHYKDAEFGVQTRTLN